MSSEKTYSGLAKSLRDYSFGMNDVLREAADSLDDADKNLAHEKGEKNKTEEILKETARKLTERIEESQSNAKLKNDADQELERERKNREEERDKWRSRMRAFVARVEAWRSYIEKTGHVEPCHAGKQSETIQWDIKPCECGRDDHLKDIENWLREIAEGKINDDP